MLNNARFRTLLIIGMLTATGACTVQDDGVDEVELKASETDPEPEPVDVIPPILSQLAPSGVLPVSTTQATLQISTNESASCKYQATSDTDYDSMGSTLDSTADNAHSASLSGLQAGNRYLYFIRCMDDSGNKNTQGQRVEFSISTGSAVSSRSSVAPEFSEQSAQFIGHSSGINLLFTPTASNQSAIDGLLYWTKDYGPDGVKVHPETGQVSWDIDDNMPSESFHVGLKVSSSNASVAVNFIVHAGLDPAQVKTVGEGGDYASLKYGLSAMGAGDTLVVLDGTYSGNDNFIGLTGPGSIQHPPSGNSAAFTTVMAQNPGRAILRDGAYIRVHGQWPVSYVAFKGFYVIDGQVAAFGYGENRSQSTDRHHHLKFIRNGVEGGDTKSPFNAFRSDDILFENNYALGGGRYKFASYQSSNIVWRRNVARYDRGPVHNEPKGTYAAYTTQNVFVSNSLAIDGDDPRFVMQGELAGEFTTPTTSGPSIGRFQRNMQINSAFLFGNMDEQISNGAGGDSDVEHSDVVSWDVRPYSRYVMSWGSAWFDHMTMGEISPLNFTGEFFNSYHNNTRGITNSILHNFKNGDMFDNLQKDSAHLTQSGSNYQDLARTVERYGADTLNISGFTGTLNVNGSSNVVNISALDPIQSDSNTNGSLRYLTRLEAGTGLTGHAIDGENMGATVMTLVGKSGTFYGEEGYDVETNIAMWPFPMEDLIKEKFAQYSYTGPTYTGHYGSRIEGAEATLNGARGFAVEGQSLTNYVWGYLGNVVPPFNVTASVEGTSVLLQWSAGPNVSQDLVTGYRVSSYDPVSGESVFIADVGSAELSHRINEQAPSSDHSYVVTALQGSEESGFSYPVLISIP